MPTFSYSTAGFGDHDVEAALDGIAAAGFTAAELGGCGTCVRDWQCLSRRDAPVPPTGRAAAEFRRVIESRGLRATTLHAPARTNVLGPPEEEWRTDKAAVLANYIRFAGEIGAPGIVIHGIPNPMYLPEDRDVASMTGPMADAMRRSLDELAPVAAGAGVRMLLENLPYVNDVSVEYPLIRIPQLRPFVEEFPAEQVGLALDIGHAWTNAQDPVAAIETAGDRLWGVHLQDVPKDQPNDDHWVPGEGGMDWPGICAALRRVGYAGAWTFEVCYGRKGESPEDLARQTYAVARSWGL